MWHGQVNGCVQYRTRQTAQRQRAQRIGTGAEHQHRFRFMLASGLECIDEIGWPHRPCRARARDWHRSALPSSRGQRAPPAWQQSRFQRKRIRTGASSGLRTLPAGIAVASTSRSAAACSAVEVASGIGFAVAIGQVMGDEKNESYNARMPCIGMRSHPGRELSS